MTDVDGCEEALRAAMLASDVDTLSALIDERLVFTGADGTVLSKEQDLEAHASGMLKLTRLDLTGSRSHPICDMVLVTTKADLAGSYGDVTIDGSFAYTRLWSRETGRWRVVAGHAARLG